MTALPPSLMVPGHLTGSVQTYVRKPDPQADSVFAARYVHGAKLHPALLYIACMADANARLAEAEFNGQWWLIVQYRDHRGPRSDDFEWVHIPARSCLAWHSAEQYLAELDRDAMAEHYMRLTDA